MSREYIKKDNKIYYSQLILITLKPCENKTRSIFMGRSEYNRSMNKIIAATTFKQTS